MIKKIIQIKTWGILLTGCIIGILGVLPYALSLQGEALAQAPLSLPTILLISVVQSSLLCAATIWFGLDMGRKVNLGVPLITQWLSGQKISQISSLIKTSVLWGMGSGIVIIMADIGFGYLGVELGLGQHTEIWKGFLASFYGGIVEEILLRLFLMTGIVWLGQKILKNTPPTLFWGAIILSSVIFGLGHLPTTATLTDLTPLVITRAIVLNGIGGMVFGWLYWKKGLESAMIAHFSADIVLHVCLPFVL